MPSFGVISEGSTDQAVIKNILCGYFGEEPDTTQIQPPSDSEPGGWTVLFKCFEAGRHKEALQHNDYLIVQIDTDVSEHKGYDVPRRDSEGKEFTPEELAGKVIERLKRAMGEEFCRDYSERLIFAISVHSLECWLLPLLFDSEPTSAGKIAGCLSAANNKLRRLDQATLSDPNEEKKDLAVYRKISKAYQKRKSLRGVYQKNPSLRLFIEQLELRCPLREETL
jgi:Domain of unknown function (DUF4276)